jgi:hypothetical protein
VLVKYWDAMLALRVVRISSEIAKISNRNSYVPAEDKVVGRIEREAR